MMSIGSAPPPQRPQQSIQDKLSEQVSSGEISAEDEDAMLAALDTIHEEMAPDGPPAAGSEPPSQEEMQEKLDGLLAEQVDAGTLTQEQADDLSAMFESGEMAPPPPPPGGAGGSGETDDESEDLMAKLLEELQSQTGYSENGGSTTTSVESLLVDYQA